MAERKQVYKCELCGNVVEVLHGADGDLVCCGAEMVLFEEKAADEGKEKHVPVVEATTQGVKVKVGSNPHPMEEKHYIEWIEVIDGETSCRHYLKPGQTPEAVFKGCSKNVTAREYCNVHGLWKS
ncbi:desulfoferrodoxin [Desulfobacter hydrogenophilus]|uniref:Desulfoferrodoxin n=1 Tax=Desulfobacter hydrogenophilus TaxID=2291 RepID=A0A328FI96_9BACT|nr:desulfoferrodoxin [Desulfobacter hydrogenophilus]NDY70639.1 desulfoferrodoxin [Desulfobacter hydrogenophilus]QBH14003.1 desulfoferrodoxin [Desulfobacter hydrogenophilus]RAM03580.1 desulfoferrodoxin [Desulfobacter hydrogenophilus]